MNQCMNCWKYPLCKQRLTMTHSSTTPCSKFMDKNIKTVYGKDLP